MPGLLDLFLYGVLVPAVVAAGLVAAALAAGRRIPWESSQGLGLVLGLGLGSLAGQLGVFWPAWPPLDVTDRIPFLVACAMIAGLIESIRPSRVWIVWGSRVLMTVITLTAMLGPIFSEWWKSPGTILGGTLLAAAVLLIWANLEAIGNRLAGSVLFLPLLLVTTAASVVLVLSGSMVLGRLGGALTAALAGCWLVSWRVHSLNLARGGTSIVVVSMACLFLNAKFYAEAPMGSLELLSLTPALLWLVELGPLRRRSPWLRALVATSITLVPIAVAIGLAVAAMPSYEY